MKVALAILSILSMSSISFAETENFLKNPDHFQCTYQIRRGDDIDEDDTGALKLVSSDAGSFLFVKEKQEDGFGLGASISVQQISSYEKSAPASLFSVYGRITVTALESKNTFASNQSIEATGTLLFDTKNPFQLKIGSGTSNPLTGIVQMHTDNGRGVEYFVKCNIVK